MREHGKRHRLLGFRWKAELIREMQADGHGSSSRRNIAISVGFFAPPPETIICFATAAAARIRIAATRSAGLRPQSNAPSMPLPSPLRRACWRRGRAGENGSTYSRPNSSRPAVRGGFWRKKGARNNLAITPSSTRPEAAILPLRSKRFSKSSSITASITMLPGPVSKARTWPSDAPAGIAVRFAIPPIFCAMRFRAPRVCPTRLMR